MVQGKSEAKVSISDESHEDNLPAKTRAAELDASNSVMVDAAENNVLFQSEYKVHTVKEAEKENSATFLAAEDEYVHEIHAAEELEVGLEEAKEGEEGFDDYDDDNDDDVDDNVNYDSDFDEGEDGLDDYDDDDDVIDDADEEDDEDDDENNFLMEEEEEEEEEEEGQEEEEEKEEEEEIDERTQLENNDNSFEEIDESQRKRVAQEEKGKNAKGENQEKEGRSLEKKVKTLSKGRERKKVSEEVSDKSEEVSRKVPSKRKDKQEDDGQGDAMVEGDQENPQNKEGSSKQKVKKLSRSKRRKIAAGDIEKAASKRGDKVESSCRKKVKSMGMIFMCSSKTKKDCYHYKVLGLPANKREVVGKIYKGMRLFLYDVDLKLLYGIYKAAGPGGYNIQPRAFNSQFPSQVRFTVLEDCLPLAEEKFKTVIKDNYFTRTKFDCQLTSQQVKNLCKLFVSASKGSKVVRSARRVRTRASAHQDRSRTRGEERQSAKAKKRRYSEHSRNHEREVVATPAALVPGRLLPPAAVPQSYAYDRALELDSYRRDRFVEHRDSHRRPVPEPHYGIAPYLEHSDVYRRDPVLYQLDSYGQDVAVEHLDLRLRDEIGRRDPYISYREHHKHRDLRSRDDLGWHDPYFSYGGSSEDHNIRSEDEFRRRDPYTSLRERRRAYRDLIHGAGPLAERDHYRPINRSGYPSAVSPLPEYRSARSLYRY